MFAKSSYNLSMVNKVNHLTTYQAGVLQAHAHRQLQKYCDEVLAPFDITKMQWLIIGTVLDAGPKGVRISELAPKLGTTLPYLTNTINLLESKNILVRRDDTKDNRSKLVVVSKKFRPKCGAIEQTLRDALRESIYTDIAPNDFKTYLNVLRKLADIEK